MKTSKKFNNKAFAASLFAMAVSVGIGTVSQASAQGTSTPKTYYVSCEAPVGVNDGSSWQKAWRELSKIDWSKILPGDTILIDGGRYDLQYHDTLKIGADGLPFKPITIAAANEPNHNGVVVITQYNSPVPGGVRNGIEFGNHKNVYIVGRTVQHSYGFRRSIVVSHFLGSGVTVSQGASGNLLRRVHIYDNGYQSVGRQVVPGPGCAGVKLVGQATCDHLVVANNANTNIEISNSGSFTNSSIIGCWIHNTGYGYKGSDGITYTGVNDPTYQDYMVDRCVIGPRLENGIVQSRVRGRVNMSNLLFLEPELTNIKRGPMTDAEARLTQIYATNVTSFLDPLNSKGRPHSCLSFAKQRDGLHNSVFWGGIVDVTGTSALGVANTQFRTSGNTVMLSASQVDPKFQTNPDSIPRGAYFDSELARADFRLSASSPAAGKGSSVTSVQTLLNE